MTLSTSQSLPEYEKPPVVEVVCGILFEPIETLLMPYFGLLWEKFKAEYSNCQEVAPLIPTIEYFDEQTVGEFKISDVPPLPRIWFIHANGNGIIQVQRDRFLYNWRKMRLEDEYPRYHSVIHMFQNHLLSFQTFLKEAELGVVKPLQYEMTYINHIPKGDGWETNSDIGNVFSDFAWHAGKERFLSAPDKINWRTSFALPNREGRLHVKIQTGVSREDEHPLLLFELTVRGIGTDTSAEAMWAWFDLAHEWIVRGFTDLTNVQIQENIWRRKK